MTDVIDFIVYHEFHRAEAETEGVVLPVDPTVAEIHYYLSLEVAWLLTNVLYGNFALWS